MKDPLNKFYIFTVLCLIFIGCKNSTNIQPHYAMGVADSVEGKVPVKVVLEGTTSSSRSIAPDHIGVGQLQLYTLKIQGSSNMGDVLAETTFTHTNGQGVVALKPGVWTLRLTAVSGTTTVLEGSATVDVREEKAKEVRFTLTPVTGGTGTIRLTINWQNDDRLIVQPSGALRHDLKVRTYLCDVETGAMVAGTEASMGRQANKNNTNLPVTFTYTGNATATDRTPKPAGKYELVFTIVGGNLPEATSSVEWRDIIYVEPGRETTGIITIPRLIQNPTVPTNFTETCTPINGNGNYDATLSWDSIYNATAYKLEVMKYVTGTTRPGADGTWTTAAARPGSVVYAYTGEPGAVNNYTNPSHGSGGAMKHLNGGLLAGHGSITYRMKMSSGEGFAARIKAVNSFGESAWVYLGSSMVPDKPYPPSSLTGVAGEMRTGDKFYADFGWKRGIVDANGTYELELLAFTGGTKPTDEATWNAAQGRATYSHTARSTGTGSPAVVSVGGLDYDDDSIQLDITGTTKYYTARLRAKNSEGGVSDWLYIPQILLPIPVYTNAVTTGAFYEVWDYVLGSRQPVWDATMHLIGPKSGTRYNTSWLRLVRGSFAEALDNDAKYEEMSRYAENYGSNLNGQVQLNATTERREQMNNNSAFIFRIRLETPYGNSPWWYWPQEVRQLP